MKTLDRIARFFRRDNQVVSHYGAAWNGPDKAWIPGQIASARYDVSSMAQRELLRKARYFEKNDPLVQKILDLIETNVVGTGMIPTPDSSSPAFNAQVKDRWEKWVTIPDLASLQSFYAIQGIIARAVACDGEIFVRLTKGDMEDPRIQLIESHRVVDARSKELENKGYILVDGIYVDPRGRPAFYCVANDYNVMKGSASGLANFVPASEIVHFFEPSRAGQYRGLTLFHSVLETLHDLDDIQRFEMIAAKDAARISKVLKTRSGAADKNDIWAGDRDMKSKIQHYQSVYGAETKVLELGDEYTQFMSSRPTVTTQQFWEYLERRICKGVGISYAAIQDYSVSWGGAALRAAVISDSRFYAVRSSSLASGFSRIYRHVTETDIQNKYIKGAPVDFWKAKWHTPRRATADIGHDSASTINELRAGLRTFEDVYGAGGQSAMEQLRKRAEEAALIKSLAKEFGVDASAISALDPNERTVAVQADLNSQNQGGQNGQG